MTVRSRLRRCGLSRRKRPDADARGEAAFRRYRVAVTAQLSVFAAVILLLATVLWWPLDGVVLSDPAVRDGFHWLRVRAVVVEVPALLAFTLSRRARRASLFLGPLSLVLLLGSFGFSLGRVPARDHAALSDAMLGIIAMSLLPERLWIRATWASAAGVALVAGYFIGTPSRWEVPGASMQVSFCAFAVVLTAAIGEVSYRVLRRAFLQRRELDAANGKLAAMSSSLSRVVSERTQRLRDLAMHLADVQESERRRIARDLHDDLGQSLTALRYTLARLVDRAPPADDRAQDLVDDMGSLLDGTFTTVRMFLSQLRPRILDDLGLIAAADWLVARTSDASAIPFDLVVTDEARAREAQLDSDLALPLFRALQEGLTNALRHGKPSRVRVEIDADADRFVLRIEDDGAGFDPNERPSGFGLLGLRERLVALGGAFDLRSSPGEGTTLTASVPLKVSTLASDATPRDRDGAQAGDPPPGAPPSGGAAINPEA